MMERQQIFICNLKFQNPPSHFSLGRRKSLKQSVPLLHCLWIIPLPDGMSVLQQGSLDWICIVWVYIWFLALDGLSIPGGSNVSFPFAGFGATLTQ